MGIPVIRKLPQEVFPVFIDFINATNDSDPFEIDSLAVAATDEAGTDVSLTLLNADRHAHDANRAEVWVQQGTMHHRYLVSVTVTMATGEVKRQDFYLRLGY